MDYYDVIAEGYDGLHGPEQIRKAAIIAHELKETYIVLDVGCGSAVYFDILAGNKVGVDPSLGLLKKAKGGFFIQAKAESLPFKSSSFDYVISLTAVHNFDDIKKGIAEIARVTKKSAALSILRASQKCDLIDREIRKKFNIRRIICESKDIIYFLDKKI
jgi:ubiquinone/menaquinone biosynthesis C-methylase UbiE